MWNCYSWPLDISSNGPSPEEGLSAKFCVPRGSIGFLLFLELQKSLLASFQGCWTQWQRFKGSSIHHFWDTLQHSLKTHFCLKSGFLSFLELQKSLLVSFQGVEHNGDSSEGFIAYIWGFWRDTWENVHLVLWSSANFCNIS